jgi:predicted nucleotide-binding protein (sugar kinase/HSP70/actin superfamily)
LDRLRAIFTTWNVSDAAIVGLSAEWARVFGSWHVTDYEVEKAIDHCRSTWTRVPPNITKEFEAILQKAMTVKDIGTVVAAHSYSKQEHYYQIFDRMVKKIKSKNPDLVGQEGGAEINEMIQSHIRFALQEHPELAKDEPFSVQLIQYAECLA